MKKYVAGIVALIIIGLIIVLTFSNSPQKIKTATVKRDNIVQSLRVTTKAEPQSKQIITAPISGEVAFLNAVEGSVVSKNQTVITIDSFEVRENFLLSKKRLIQKENTVKNLEKKVERTLSLFKKGSAKETELNELQEQLKAEQEELEIDKTYLALQNKKFNLSTVKSLISGVIIETNKNLTIGKYIGPGEFICTIGDPESIELIGKLAASDLKGLSIGQLVRVINPNKTLDGKISHISEVANNNQFEIHVKPLEAIKPGSIIDIEIYKIAKENVIKIPHQALDDNHSIWLVRNARLKKLQPKFGAMDIWGIEIASDQLKEGDVIAIYPKGFKEGMKVVY